MKISYTAPEDVGEISLKTYLKRQGVSKRLWRRLKNNGTVTVNSEAVNLTRTVLKGGESITLYLPEASDIVATDLPLDVRYEDAALLIVNKPAPMLVHPVGSEATHTLGNAVAHYLLTKGENATFHPLHRLDRNTTGLVLLAKQPNIQHLLTTGAKKLFTRRYLAVIEGEILPREGDIDAPIEREPTSIVKQRVSSEGKRALTHYRTIGTSEDKSFSLLELTLSTGRTHQIRVHLSYLAHPLLGDDLYGGDNTLISRQALHAHSLTVTHPFTRKELTVIADPPEDFISLLEKTGLKNFLVKIFQDEK